MSNALSHLSGTFLAGLLTGDDQTRPDGNGGQTIMARVLEEEWRHRARQRAKVNAWRDVIGDNRQLPDQ